MTGKFGSLEYTSDQLIDEANLLQRTSQGRMAFDQLPRF
jgi:hypothetical protein